MDLAHIDELLAQFDASTPVEEAWTPPAAWYTDPAWFELERTAVLGRSWQPVCRLDEVVAAGSYVAGRVLGAPWTVVRGQDGELRAFHAVCRHHGTVLLDGAGRCDQIVCPYHGWTYDLDGALRSAPRMAGVRDFDRADFGLAPLRHEVRGPYVFVELEPAVGRPADGLAEVWSRLETDGPPLAWSARRTYEVACNWKVFVDNYLDGGYHVARVHPDLAGGLDLDGYTTEAHDAWSLQRCGAAGGERLGGAALYAFAHPNLMLNRYGPVLDVNVVLPLAVDRSLVVFDWFFQEGTDEAFIERSVLASDGVQQEDIAVSESVQVGLASPSYDRGRYAPRVEHAMHAFHVRLAHDVRAAHAEARA